MFRFLQADVFKQPGTDVRKGFQTNQERRDVEAFMLAFDNDIAPIVGQQVTLDALNATQVGPRITLMISRALTAFTSQVLGGTVTECDLITKGIVNGEPRASWLQADGTFKSDDAQDPPIPDAYIRNLALTAGQEVTYTCVPPGSGRRMGIDRDLDTILNHDDNCPNKANADQLDFDADGIGNVCDNVSDGMRVLNDTRQAALVAAATDSGDSESESGACAIAPLGKAGVLPLSMLGLIGLGLWRRRRQSES